MGVRDMHLLESALGQPQISFGGQDLYTGLADKAAAYWFHLIKNHPFIDGNKRTGTMVCDIFLRLNGKRMILSRTELFDIAMQIATSLMTKDDLVRVVQQSMQDA